jgi:hypothetical protein
MHVALGAILPYAITIGAIALEFEFQNLRIGPLLVSIGVLVGSMPLMRSRGYHVALAVLLLTLLPVYELFSLRTAFDSGLDLPSYTEAYATAKYTITGPWWSSWVWWVTLALVWRLGQSLR